MTITGLQPYTKGRFKVYIDDSFAFVLYKGEISKYRMEEGSTITEDMYNEILHILLPARARARSLNLLEKRDYTVRALTDKLSEGLYPEEVIAETMEFLQDSGFVNDRRYAHRFLELHYEEESRLALKKRLMQRGISVDLIEDAFHDYEEEHPGTGEAAALLNYMRKKGIRPDELRDEERQKKQLSLMRKGFSPELIGKVFRHYDEYVNE